MTLFGAWLLGVACGTIFAYLALNQDDF